MLTSRRSTDASGRTHANEPSPLEVKKAVRPSAARQEPALDPLAPETGVGADGIEQRLEIDVTPTAAGCAHRSACCADPDHLEQADGPRWSDRFALTHGTNVEQYAVEHKPTQRCLVYAWRFHVDHPRKDAGLSDKESTAGGARAVCYVTADDSESRQASGGPSY